MDRVMIGIMTSALAEANAITFFVCDSNIITSNDLTEASVETTLF